MQARKFSAIKENMSEEHVTFHLSNNMCPQHKLDMLEAIKRNLKDQPCYLCGALRIVKRSELLPIVL